jgi:hypothetical protein
MRDLNEFELKFVSGAGSSPSGDCTCPTPTDPDQEKKGNNGFGNGADPNLAAPGQFRRDRRRQGRQRRRPSSRPR